MECLCPSGAAPAKPVLDAFTDNEEIALDEALDDLAVSLLPRTQLARCRNCLIVGGGVKC